MNLFFAANRLALKACFLSVLTMGALNSANASDTSDIGYSRTERNPSVMVQLSRVSDPEMPTVQCYISHTLEYSPYGSYSKNNDGKWAFLDLDCKKMGQAKLPVLPSNAANTPIELYRKNIPNLMAFKDLKILRFHDQANGAYIYMLIPKTNDFGYYGRTNHAISVVPY